MDCNRSTGSLFWKKPCGNPSIGACDECRIFICQMHGNIRGDGGITCNACHARDNDDSSDSGSSISFGSSDSSSSSFDSSSSGSSDSGGGGDSGGSSSD
jgi:hypothetical protein